MDGTVLFVCHANLCRSPMAEYLARDLLAGSAISVTSAGTHAQPGRPAHPHAVRILGERGLDPTSFRSRPLSRIDLTAAGLVLTASRRERAACVALSPAALGRVFTLRQFARLATAALGAVPPTLPRHADPGPLGSAVTAALRARALVQSV
ncbi:MAG TPA: low molecular weight phosphatase family protein, partial [Micromonospora sp.]